MDEQTKIKEQLFHEVDGFKSLALFNSNFEVVKPYRTLTPQETEARKEWNETRTEFVEANWDDVDSVNRRITSAQDFVSSVIVPPQFQAVVESVSSRSRYDEPRGKRYYPLRIAKWDKFATIIQQEIVETFNPTTIPVMVPPLRTSAFYLGWVSNENDEEVFLEHVLWAPSFKLGLMCDKSELRHTLVDKGQIANMSPVVGLPDRVDYAGPGAQNPTIMTCVIEIKSSHNLLIPNEFESVREIYENVVEDQANKKSNSRSKDWSHIGHPLGQIFAYMVDNGVRFGALCCAAKTFFVFFDGENGDIGTVRITEAYLTTQRDFVRAWASFTQEARLPKYGSIRTPFSLPAALWFEENSIKEEENEEGTTRVDLTRSSDDETDQGGHESGKSCGEVSSGKRSASEKGTRSTRKFRRLTETRGQGLDETEESELVDVISQSLKVHSELFDFEDDFVAFYKPTRFKIGKVLGRGRNGEVFLSDFKGEAVAVKQFDLSKNFESYKYEVLAYKHLKSAWGALVPEPKFISSSPSGMVRFLGLQLGSWPDDADTSWSKDERAKLMKEYYKVLEELRKKHGFRLFSSDYGHDTILVPGHNPDAKKLLVFDLDFWEADT